MMMTHIDAGRRRLAMRRESIMAHLFVWPGLAARVDGLAPLDSV